jgi:L-rhamnose-H+ transport protein
LYKNQSWKLFAHAPQDAFLSLLMGLLWIGAVLIYGLSTRYLGRLGDSAGWAIYQIVMVLTANTAGIVTGEWKSASRRSYLALASGVLILVLATVTTAVSTR